MHNNASAFDPPAPDRGFNSALTTVNCVLRSVRRKRTVRSCNRKFLYLFRKFDKNENYRTYSCFLIINI